jgi:hypothetical protein
MFKNLPDSHQFLKWLLIIAACFFLVFGAVSLYINIWVQPKLAQQLKESIAAATAKLYSIQFSSMSVNVLTGDANLNNVKFVPDTAVLNALILSKKAPNNVYYIQLRKLSIRNVHPLRVLREKKLNIDEVEILHPKITMINKQYDFNEKAPLLPEESPYDLVLKHLREVRIATISFKDISFKYIDNNHATPVIDSLEHLNLILQHWLIDSNSAKDTSRFYLLKEIKLQLNDYSYATSDSLYHVKASEINFTGSTGVLDIKKLALVPRYSEMKFGKVLGYGKDRFSIQLSHINLKGIHLPLFIKKQELYAREMIVTNGRFDVFNNNEIPGKEADKTGQYPHQLLQKLQHKVTIKKLELSNIDISYSEYDRDSKEKGRITFENTSGTISNITNAAKELKENPYMEANLNTFLMGQGRLHTRFNFNMLAKDGAFSYSGVLHGLNGSAMNSVTKPLGMLHIKSAMIQKLSFNIKANDHKAVGKMEFRYRDLSVALLKKEDGMSWYSRQGLLSFLANNLVIKPDNPDHKGVFTTARIDYERKPTRSFFNFVWKSLFQGIRYSVGITPAKEAEVKAYVVKFEKIKKEREKRRAAKGKKRDRN